MRRFRKQATDEGSLLVVMLVTLLLTSLLAVLMITTLISGRQTRHSLGVSTAHLNADQGVQQALFEANAGKPVPSSPRTRTAADGASYSWTATTQPDGTRLVVSTGTARGVTRVMKAIIKPMLITSTTTTPTTTTTTTSPAPAPAPADPAIGSSTSAPSKPFAFGVFADDSAVLRGVNTVDSYNSASSPAALNTGQGAIGTNTVVSLLGNATADWVDVWNGASCTGAVCSTKKRVHPEKFDVSNIDFIDAGITACGIQRVAMPMYVASVDGPLTSGTKCYSGMVFDVTTTPTSTPAAPTIVYTFGAVTVGRGVSVNVATSNGDTANAPKASRLQIYSSGPIVGLGNSNASPTKVAWAMYAPKAICAGNPSNAQADIYGAMVCAKVSNQGGFGFHVDTALASSTRPGNVTSTTTPPPTTTAPTTTSSGTSTTTTSTNTWSVIRVYDTA